MEAKKSSNLRLWAVGAIVILTFPLWAAFIVLAFIFYGVPVAIGSEVRTLFATRVR